MKFRKNKEKKQFIDSNSHTYFFLNRLLPIQVNLTLFSFFITWLSQYFLSDGNPKMIEKISFRVMDEPWMPPGQKSFPVIGLHHFGDWNLDMGWAMIDNCYALPTYKCPKPPLGNWILRLFGIWSSNYSFAYVVWILVATVIFLNAIKLVALNFSLIERTNFIWFGVIFSVGNVISFDRGSMHIMAFALLTNSIIYYYKNDNKKAMIFFILAVSLKPQLLLASVFLLHEKKFGKFLYAAAIPVLSNMVLMFTYPGNFIENIKGYLLASGGYVSSADSLGNIMNSVSLVGFYSRFIEYQNGSEFVIQKLTSLGKLMILPGVVWILATAVFVYFSTAHLIVKSILSLALISLSIPSSGPYLMGWISIIGFLLVVDSSSMSENYKSKFKEPLDSLDKFLISAIAIAGGIILFVSPFPVIGLGRQLQFTPLIPLLLLLLMVNHFRKTQKQRS